MARNNEVKQADSNLGFLQIYKQASQVYIVEFIFLHLALLGVFIVATNLFNRLVDYTQESSEGLSVDIYSYIGIDTTLLMISAGIVMAGLLVMSHLRTAQAEKTKPSLLKSNTRRVWQYVFLAITMAILIVYKIVFIYLILFELFSSLSDYTDGNFWLSFIKLIFAIILLLSIMFYVVKNISPKEAKK